MAERPGGDGYVHDALFYGAEDDLLAAAVPFLRAGLRAGECVAVQAGESVASLLSGALDHDPRLVVRPGADLYAHPARAAADFHRFFRRRLGAGATGFRVLGDVRVPDDPLQVTQWGCYEAAINRVFAPYPVWGLCAFDTRQAPPEVLAIAERTHPNLLGPTCRTSSPRYEDPAEYLRSCAQTAVPDLLEATAPRLSIADLTSVPGLRAGIRGAAEHCGLPVEVVDRFVVAVNEVAANALVHGRPPVRIRLWATPQRLLCTVSDTGPGFDDPFAGYRAVDPHAVTQGGVGLTVARQFCDQVQIGPTPDGFTVRLASNVGYTRAV